MNLILDIPGPPDTVHNQKKMVPKYVRDLNNPISHYYRLVYEQTEA